ncbi:MAG TPA: hypothetical protein VMZ28_05025, partial [Kofleriaceae bacterium]|nr:hypothetical protein [Kofleriaceae bacterium]
DGDLVAEGGRGADGGGGLAATGGGSGGGGSGGAVMLRASALTVASGMVSAAGAAGGVKYNDGGLGADGRARVDVATPALPGLLSVEPELVRGPRWADDTPYLVGDDELELTLYGEPNTQFGAIVESGDPEAVMTDGAGVGTLQVTLERGRNHICALISPTASVGDPEAIQSIYVTYIP